ncbi:hypothetical protein C7E24_16285 [Stenotrophomonas maltophilia]|nr:hypothetical protein C7E24_16285 [Stenotrophomonas maltophilia]
MLFARPPLLPHMLLKQAGAGREVRCARFAPIVATQRLGPSLCLPSPRPCRGSPSTEGLVPPETSVDPRHAWMRLIALRTLDSTPKQN